VAHRGGVLCESARWKGLPIFVKTLLVDDAQTRDRFSHEARVLATLNHRGVVPLLAVTSSQMIFPFVEGGTLRDRLERGPLNPDESTAVALGLLDSVGYLHSQGVTHHDLKPENILLGGGRLSREAVRVIDFGMSHARSLPQDIHSGTRMGTPHFMAPEQFYGVRGDPRSDLYSVGALLFDCLAGYPPFEDALGWLAGIHGDRAPWPGPDVLHPIMAAALSRDLADRPTSARGMQRALEAARQQLGLPPAPCACAVVGRPGSTTCH
jgi:serine/threonine-protein kinase